MTCRNPINRESWTPITLFYNSHPGGRQKEVTLNMGVYTVKNCQPASDPNKSRNQKRLFISLFIWSNLNVQFQKCTLKVKFTDL